MKFTIKTGNQRLSLLLIAVIALSAIGIVSGYGSGDPMSIGHTAGEIEGFGTFDDTNTYIFPSGSTVKILGDNLIKSSGSGSVFVHWGSLNAPPETTLLYSGIGFNKRNDYKGGGMTSLCVEVPDATTDQSSNSNCDRAFPMHTHLDTSVEMPPNIDHNKIMKCSVVYSERMHMTIFGTDSCPTGWKSSYTGYSMSGSINNRGNYDRICIDNVDFDDSTTSLDNDRSKIVSTRITNVDDITGFSDNTFVKCAVCVEDLGVI